MAYAMDGRGGGNALPPYLQGRTPNYGGGYGSQPMITPRPTVAPGEARPRPAGRPNPIRPQGPQGLFGKVFQMMQKRRMAAKPAAMAPKPAAMTPKPQLVPQNAAAAPKQPINPYKSAFDYGKGELEAERNRAMSSAVSDAAARGVYYGTPLTTSQGDIQTEYMKGLGNLAAQLSMHQADDYTRRLGLAGNMIQGAPQIDAAQIDPSIYQTLGTMFATPGKLPKPKAKPVVTPKGQSAGDARQDAIDEEATLPYGR